MRKVLFLLMAVGFLFLMNSQAAQAVGETGKPQNVGNKSCPVLGNKIDEKMKATVEYEGKIYNLCCPGCIEEFKKDPQKYIAIVEQELKSKAQEENSDQGMKGMDMGMKGMDMSMHEGHVR